MDLDFVSCAKCGHIVPVANYTMHDLRCSSKKLPQKDSIISTSSSQYTSTKNHHNAQGKLDFSSLLSTSKRKNEESDQHVAKQAKTNPTFQQSSFSPNQSLQSLASSKQPSQSKANHFRCAASFGGWVRRPAGMETMNYALANLPSTFDPNEVAWVSLDTYKHSASTAPTQYSGKWMWFVYESQADEKFILLADALENGLLGDCIKVPPVNCKQKEQTAWVDKSSSTTNNINNNSDSSNGAGTGAVSASRSSILSSGSAAVSRASSSAGNATASSGERAAVVPFIVYTSDFRDRAEVQRVGLELRKLIGYSKTISYKPGQHFCFYITNSVRVPLYLFTTMFCLVCFMWDDQPRCDRFVLCALIWFSACRWLVLGIAFLSVHFLANLCTTQMCLPTVRKASTAAALSPKQSTPWRRILMYWHSQTRGRRMTRHWGWPVVAVAVGGNFKPVTACAMVWMMRNVEWCSCCVVVGNV